MNSLTDLITLLTNSINNGELVLDSELLPEAGQLAGYVGVSELIIYNAAIASSQTNVTVTGTVSFLSNSNMSAVLTGWVSNGQVLFTLEATLFPAGWIFSDSFGRLPFYSDFSQNLLVIKKSFFNQFEFDNPAFILSTFDNEANKLAVGLNFRGLLTSAPGTPLAYLAHLNDSTPLALYGTIVLEPAPAPPLINLRGDLTALDFIINEAQIKDVHIALQTLKPDTTGLSEPEEEPESSGQKARKLATSPLMSAVGLAGTVSLGTANPIELVISTQVMNSSIWILDGKAKNDNLSLANGLGVLSSLFGIPVSSLQLPSALQKFSTFYLSEISIGVSTSDLSVEQIFIAVGSPETWVLPFANFAVTNIRTGWMLFLPFDSIDRSLSGYVGGTLEFGVQQKVGLAVTALMPDFTVYAQLLPGDTISVADALSFLFGDSSSVIDLTIVALSLMIDCNKGEYALTTTIDEDWSVPLYINNVSVLELTQLKLLVNYGAGSLSGRIIAGLEILGVRFSVSAAKPPGDEGWIFRGQMELGQELNLGDLVKSFLPSDWNVTLPESLSSLTIAALAGSFNTKLNTFSFATKIVWSVDIVGEPLTIDADFNLRSLRKTAEAPAVYAGEIAGKATFEGLDLMVKYEFKPNSSELTLSLDGFTCAIAKTPKGDIVIDLSMGDLSLGQLLTYVVNLVYPTADFQLDSPWDVLNDINFHNLHFEINATQEMGSVWYDLNLNLDFVDIQSIGVAYQMQPTSGVELRIAGRFLNKVYTKDQPLSWNPATQRAPRVPGKGESLLELRYVGIGQHVTFKDPDQYNSIYQVLKAVGVDFKPIEPKSSGSEEAESSEDSLDQLKFDETSGWLLAADLVFLDTLTTGGVFNDPVLYGLYIGVSGEKAGIFDGLNFQILYKKISDGLGEYALQLKLPNSMRHLSFGEFAITLPIIGIKIYTNGNFNLDLGFPYHNDFARSFDIQVFPFIGSGGFYVAYLNSETSSTVPQISNGTFNPVLEFGLGLQLGIGKNIYWGVLTAGLSIDLDGILQGCLAFFEPYNPTQPGGIFYELQGTLALVGNMHGSINLSVIRASISLTLYAQTGLTIESHAPIELSFSIGVSFQVSVKVTFVNVHLNFNANFTVKYSLGSASPTPWVLAEASAPASPQAEVVPRALALASTAALSWSQAGWKSFSYWGNGPQTLNIIFAPAVTVAPSATAGDFTPQLVCLLFIENAIGSEQAGSAFDQLAQGLLAWALNLYLQSDSGAELNQQTVTAADLSVLNDYLTGVVTPTIFEQALGMPAAEAQELYQELLEQGVINATGKIVNADAPLTLSPALAPYADAVNALLANWQQPFSYEQLTAYLQANFNFSVQPQPGGTPAEVSGTVFPMFPELAISSAQSGQINFNTKSLISAQYLQDLNQYFGAGLSGSDFEAKDTVDAGKSLATLVFNDYFGLIVQSATQAANSLLSAYPYTIQSGDTLDSVSQQFGDVNVTQLAASNQFQTAALNSDGGGLQLFDIAHQIAAGETLDGLAQNVSNSLHTLSAAQIATANQFVGGALQAGQKLSLASLSFTLQAAQSLSRIAARFYAQPQNISIANGGVADSDTTNVYDSSNPGAYVPPPSSVLTIAGIVYQVAAQTPNTLLGIAEYFAVDPSLIAALNLQADFRSSLPVGTQIVIPPVNYVVPPCTADAPQSALAAYFGTTTDALSSDDNVIYTITNATYTVQPADSLIGIAQYLFLTVDALTTLIGQQPVLKLGAQLSLPKIVHAIAPGDTLNAVATAYNVTVDELAAWNAQTENLLAADQTVTVPDATVTVQTLMDTLGVSNAFNSIATQVSRFLLYGLRLPTPDQPVPATPAEAVMSGLYELTGQQFAVTAPVTGYTIDLTSAANTALPGWVTLPPQTSYTLTSDDLSLLNGIGAAASQLSFNPPQPLVPYKAVNRTFALRNSVTWRSLASLPYPVQSPANSSSGGPVLWPLPKSLQVQLHRAGVLALQLKTGTQSNGRWQTTEVDDYIWATSIALRVRQIPALQQAGTTLPNVYQVQGTDAAGREALAALINSFKPGASSGLTLQLLYSTNAASSEAGSLQSDMSVASDRQTVQLVKTNLATDSLQPSAPTVLFNLQQEGFNPSQQTASSGAVVSDPATYQNRTAWNIELNSGDWVNWASDPSYSKSVLPDFSTSDTLPTKIRFQAIGAQGGEQIVFGLTVGTSDNPFYFNQTLTLTNEWASYELDLTALGVPVNFAQQTSTPFWCKVDGTCRNSQLPVQFWLDAQSGIEYAQTVSDSPSLAQLSDAQSFLELLWEADAAPGGGFYLYYQTAQQPTGLPAAIFNGGVEANLTLLALSGDTTSVSSLRNCLVIGTPISTQASVFFAETSDLQDERLTVEPGHAGFALTQPPLPTIVPPTTTDDVLLEVNSEFAPSGWIGDPSPPSQVYSMADPQNYQGKNAWQITYSGGAGQWGGVQWQPNAQGASVPAGASKITFWAMGANDGEQVLFGFSSVKTNQWTYTLSNAWTQYSIPLPDGYTPDTVAFLWICNDGLNGQKPITFYLGSDPDAIEYVQETTTGGTDEVQATLAQLYQLVGYQVVANGDFSAGAEALPVGPGVSPNQADAAAQDLYYSHLLPIPNSAIDAVDTLLPPASGNPYAGIGKTLELGFKAQDIFGNQLNAAGLTSLELPLHYYDKLTPLTQWPNVAADYAVTTGPTLNVTMDFSVSKYVPDVTTPLSTCLQRAAGDQLKYAGIYYQTTQPDVSFALTTSFGSPTAPVDKQAVNQFVTDIYAYLATLQTLASQQKLTPVAYAPTASDTLAGVSALYCVSVNDLATVNQAVAGIFAPGGALNLPTYYSAHYGDSLASIAEAAGQGVTSQSIAELNQTTPDILTPGVVLSVNGGSYTIAPGDTFASIAQTNNISVDDLAASNEDVGNLFVQGARLLLLVANATAQAGDSLVSLATGCTVDELAQANPAATLNPANELAIPCALRLSATTVGNLSLCQSDAGHASLSALAANPQDLFFANLDLLGLLQTGATVSLGEKTATVTRAIEPNDTLRTVYNWFVGQPGLAKLTQDQFAQFISAQTILSDGAILLNPPAPIALSSPLTPEFSDKISAAVVGFEITRQANLVDSSLPKDAANAVGKARTVITPQLNTAAAAAAGLSLTNFALNFEAAFDGRVKLGTAQSQSEADGAHALLIVPVGSEQSRITYDLDSDSPLFFAAPPLANRLLSRNGVAIQNYQSGPGLQTAQTQNFSNVDLDAWGRTALAALDEFLSAAYAVPTAQFDPASFQAVLDAKQTIAEAIADSVKPILAAKPAADSIARASAAREVMLQQLLQRLSNAYGIDSLIQFKTTATSMYEDAASAPRLTGRPTAGVYTINPSQNSLQTIAGDFQRQIAATESNPILASYVAEVIQNVQSIFAPRVTLVLSDGSTYAPVASDSLRSVAAALSLSVADLATQIAAQTVLTPNKTLNLEWINYQLKAGDALVTAANYLQVTTSELALANYDAQGLLVAGQTITNPQTGQSYVTVTGDTFDSALTAVGLDAADLPENLIQNSALLVAGQSIGVLKLQPGYALASADLSLANGDSCLTFPFRQSGESSSRVFLDLQYQVNGLEFDPQPLSNLAGYDRVQSLSFITPLAAAPIGQVAVPVPLKSYPTPPVLVAQNAKAAHRPGSPANLPQLKNWQYQFTYAQHEQAQDEIQASVNFNVSQMEVAAVTAVQQKLQTLSPAVSAKFAGRESVDLFAALAQFTTAYPQMAADLAVLPSLLGGQIPVPPGTQSAVKVLAQLATELAQAWTSWHEAQRSAWHLPTDFRCRIREYVDDEQNLNITVERTEGALPGPYSLPLVVADPTYWTPQQQSAPEKADSITYTFAPVGEAAESGWRQRSLALNDLDVVPTQNAWGGVWTTRNEDLLAGEPTDPAFVYSTPQVRFVNQATPLIVYGAPLNIAALDGEAGQATLAEHLSALFSQLLELGVTSKNNQLHQVKISCRYRYPLAVSSDGELDAATPVLLRPTFTFQLRDAETDDAVSDTPSFVERLAAALEQWKTANAPNIQGAYYQFEVSVFSDPPQAEIESKLLNFLTRNNTNHLTYAMSRTGMPLSFYASDGYWLKPPNQQDDPHTLDSITERLLVQYGADIYDVATMQIALSLYPEFGEGMNAAQAWTQRLLSSFSGTLQSIRGWSSAQGTTFQYGSDGTKLLPPNNDNAGAGAYYFRSIADQYLMTDPLTGEDTYPNGVTVDGLTQMHWTDWKPITGENAWAALIGPLQLAYRQHGNQLPPYDSDAVQLALKVLPAFKAMSSGCGALFYAPANTAANEAGQFVDPTQISNENNFSSYAALLMLLQTLVAAAVNETDPATLTTIQQQAQTVQELASKVKSYFQNNLLDTTDKCFYTGGNCTGESFTPSSPESTAQPFAVDVHTWGCTVLGAENVDSWFGAQGVSAYGLWQTVKQRAGYFEDGDTSKAILGVGYTDAPNGDHQYIISAEWTFGAITMCRVLAEQYGNPASPVYNSEWAASLLADAQSMTNGVHYLLFDSSRAEQGIYAYYYANRRYYIPFGWYANRIASLCSTSWGLMVQRQFNPFVLGGSYRQSMIDPDTYTVSAAAPVGHLSNALMVLRLAGIPADQQKLYNFMLVNTTLNLTDAASASQTGMPLSFYAPPNYWLTLASSNVGYDPSTVAACAERVMVHYGLDIYDAATMQIAWALYPQFGPGMAQADGQTQRLLKSFSIPQTSLDTPGSIRGWTDLSQPTDSQFSYGAQQTPLYPAKRNIAGAGAYYFRSISDQYDQMTDPYTGSTQWPDSAKVDNTQDIHWTDWKPITGENAWGAMIGPLQLAYSQHAGLPPLDSDAVKLALKVLPAYQVMTAPNGGIFYAPWNTAGNQPGTTADPLSISNENNLSSYAALTMLAQTLENGGDTENLSIVKGLLAGLESYFVNALYDETNQCFYTGGTYNNGQNQMLNAFAPGGPNFPFAVDVHTWGCTVLGVEKVDSWFGTNQHSEVTAYGLWQTVKQRAGYYQNSDTSTPILGVGYTDAPNGNHGYIISAEWTFGAINMCRVLAQQYGDTNSPFYNADYAASLWNDAQSMLAGVRQLLLDTTSRSAETEAYFYANRYYVIPFGWDANRIDSLCSTAWALMVANNFNPFVLGGFYGSSPTHRTAPATSSRPLLTLSNLRLKLQDIE